MAKSKSLNPAEEEALINIKAEIKTKIASAGINGIALSSAVEIFKNSFDSAIKVAGDKGKDSLIRSQEPIKIFHEVIKQELINNGVNPKLIFPSLGNSKGEIRLYGYFKDKDQDISVFPKDMISKPEILKSGLLHDKEDPWGFKSTEAILTINVRSQMSSIAKNIDTMFERIFAEPLNLHMRCSKLVMGEFYIIPTTGYDSDKVKKFQPDFCPKVITKRSSKAKTTAEVLEEYILAFDSVNNRVLKNQEDYKYEKVCLLIVDFTTTPYKIYDSSADLIADGLLPQNSTAKLDNLSYKNFIKDLLKIYEERFGKGKFS